MKEYRYIVKTINDKLFSLRTADGSSKEYDIITAINEKIDIAENLIKFPDYESKHVVESINFVVSEIKNLKGRKYVYFIKYFS